ncbi:hypothetical protein ACFQY9_13795 [Microvirga aerilata]|uniref:hypothetical protein n=1 Tax=Microvirga aerilata TaxID=670292 RepID=UPI003628CF31
MCFQDGAGDDVLGGDQLDLVTLAAEFEPDGAGDLGIAVGKAGREKLLDRWLCAASLALMGSLSPSWEP